MILFIQPVTYSYRLAVINAIAKHRKISVLSGVSLVHPICDYTYIKYSFSPRWIYVFFLKFIKYRYSLKVFLPAYTTHSGILIIAILAKLLGLKLLVHGQALLKKETPNLIDLSISSLWLFLSSRYIAYSYLGLIGPFCQSRKINVILNRYESLDSLNVTPIDTQHVLSKQNLPFFGILFIGRDRPCSEIPLLVSAVADLSSLGLAINLHVIGANDISNDVVKYYGPLAPEMIPSISKKCHIGVYPGDAGLSVLHYMALGLCPIVHASTNKHCGPEPSYVTNRINGLTFSRLSLDSLKSAIVELYNDRYLLNDLAINALSFSKDIHLIPYSTELIRVIE